ncbi:hypothetical protein AbraIFM66951_006306 [Aspergillus brasiliensis]|uniref:F-box domain-containing protein n=1 Tax=Aspergillus brasiliensis TaxID=319629 RepID=A0A9W5YGT4_9EURO|nr:hypothetical protein AbraCBS73388_004200 [Aspergillus brasiliensis]GKZ40775.1 hypothetical protein AbraIFM66951_006306 [Aspergillus brasiliensis]
MDSSSLNETPQTPSLNLMDLPTELHLHISTFLPYPDALALKHTCRHFYPIVYTGVHLKVDWFVERFSQKLECPMEKCSFRTDEAFCNKTIRGIMERRRRHLECAARPGGCLVIEGRTCQKDLLPLWMKKRGRWEMVRSLGNEALIHGLIFLCVYLLWNMSARLLNRQAVMAT